MDMSLSSMFLNMFKKTQRPFRIYVRYDKLQTSIRRACMVLYYKAMQVWQTVKRFVKPLPLTRGGPFNVPRWQCDSQTPLPPPSIFSICQSGNASARPPPPFNRWQFTNVISTYSTNYTPKLVYLVAQYRLWVTFYVERLLRSAPTPSVTISRDKWWDFGRFRSVFDSRNRTLSSSSSLL